MIDRNRSLLERAVTLLRPLLDELVFVGGCATGLLITDSGSGGVRPTRDVDVIAEVASYPKYTQISDRLRTLGFNEDFAGGVICRWRHTDLILDVMPTDERVLGFTNRWFQPALASARRVRLESGTIRAITPVYFLATKIEAFHGRGSNDISSSHDLEDAVAVVDGRPEILVEVLAADPDVRGYLSVEFRRLLADVNLADAVSGFLMPDAGSQARRSIVLHRLRMLASASEVRLELDNLRSLVRGHAVEIHSKAAANGTLLGTGTAKQLASVLTEHLADAADRVTNVFLQAGEDDLRAIVSELRTHLEPVAKVLVTEAARPLRSLPSATKFISSEIDRVLASLPDRAARVVARSDRGRE